jgi:ISXO2 transposase-like protein
MLHRFPRAIARPGRERLKGQVEVDGSYLALTDRQEPIPTVGRKNSAAKVLCRRSNQIQPRMVEMTQPQKLALYGISLSTKRKLNRWYQACLKEKCLSHFPQYRGWVISTISDWFEVTAENSDYHCRGEATPQGLRTPPPCRISKDLATHVIPYVQEAIEPGSQGCTDGSATYRSLGDMGYEHQRTVMLGSDLPAHLSMAGVHRVASLLKRWILGTHHESVQLEHLDAYLEESLCSASIVSPRVRVVCSSTGCSNRPWSRRR